MILKPEDTHPTLIWKQKDFSKALSILLVVILTMANHNAQCQENGKTESGIQNLHFSGTANFITFYRSMRTPYPDAIGGKKNWAFTPYNSTGSFNTNTSQQPLINLNVSGNPTPNTSFSVSYALAHFYTGLVSDSSKIINVQNLFQFEGSLVKHYGTFKITAGGGAMNLSVSPLTIYNKDFREPSFERLPWEWRTNSFSKYLDDFHESTPMTPTLLTNTASQGFIFDATDLPEGFGLRAFYGRTNFTLTPQRAIDEHPLELIAGKVYKDFVDGQQIAVNYYNQFGFTTANAIARDKREIYTLGFNSSSKKYAFTSEIGVGRVTNPESNSGFGEAISASVKVPNKKSRFPVKASVYRLNKSVASLEAAFLNANNTVQQGGYGADASYDNGLYSSYLQEVNMMANNRQGVILNAEKHFDHIRFELGYAISQELENDSNVVSYQHMTNAFSRSRFQPWQVGVGPYGRVSNRFRRSLETVAITDSSSYLKTFHAVDLGVNTLFDVANHPLILMNYVYVGSVGKSISPLNETFLTTIFYELSGYYQLAPKLSVLAFYSIQQTSGGDNTTLSTETQKPLNQKATGIGFGIDYDFAKSAGIYLRHRWMNHEDPNFELDAYRGTSTSLELKYFF